MKKGWFSTILIAIILLACFTYKDDVTRVVMQEASSYEKVLLPRENVYSLKSNFEFVKLTDDFHVKNYQGMLDAIYTVLDNGANDFSIYCDKSYSSCLDDFDKISKDRVLLSTINNMVSPYNSYEKISFRVTDYGKITINVSKLYSDEEIKSIEDKIKEFESGIKSDLNVRDKIKAFHDYLINNSVYDKERATTIENGGDIGGSSSHKATGPLIYGKALCSGYSDAMKIYLDKLGVKNYKVSNSNHIWNLVFLEGNYLHLDLTWDDPVTNTGENLLLYKFFLIDTDELLKLDPSGHMFNSDYYKEISH